MTLSYGLSLSLAVAERLAGGAVWVAALRAATAALACPPVRRAVHGALATLFAISVATRSVTPAAAAPTMTPLVVERVVEETPTVVVVTTVPVPLQPSPAPPPAATAPPPAATAPSLPATEPGVVAPAPVARHIVAPGECLSRIAE